MSHNAGNTLARRPNPKPPKGAPPEGGHRRRRDDGGGRAKGQGPEKRNEVERNGRGVWGGPFPAPRRAKTIKGARRPFRFFPPMRKVGRRAETSAEHGQEVRRHNPTTLTPKPYFPILTLLPARTRRAPYYRGSCQTRQTFLVAEQGMLGLEIPFERPTSLTPKPYLSP
jgi:hypothetical protein